jgi:integrase
MRIGARGAGRSHGHRAAAFLPAPIVVPAAKVALTARRWSRRGGASLPEGARSVRHPTPEEGHVRAAARCRRPPLLTRHAAGLPCRPRAAQQGDPLPGRSAAPRRRPRPRALARWLADSRARRSTRAAGGITATISSTVEALALAEAELDPRRGSVLVRRGKGGRRREVGMDDWAWEQLEPWLQVRVELPVGPLFCVVNGPTRGRPWSASAARSELRHLAREAGVRRRFAPHQLRHAHAVEMAREGVPLIVIQRQLGHTSRSRRCSSTPPSWPSARTGPRRACWSPGASARTASACCSR